ncbi:hypothetical protein OGAPHI_000318 [Ogataea philodendri]|uniref:Uncharacterized protein n=1 Tax=Ogataea philodendri TaxID=1378263 RepID=A0A9P8TAR5_9ASCO|nr:uncharacterized protein OGAPHI_000318 [Ogataea philodendri]KAH3671615.1 hypothetical protein OGAPHI_000318 [Ogataea philodendri]
MINFWPKRTWPKGECERVGSTSESGALIEEVDSSVLSNPSTKLLMRCSSSNTVWGDLSPCSALMAAEAVADADSIEDSAPWVAIPKIS